MPFDLTATSQADSLAQVIRDRILSHPPRALHPEEIAEASAADEARAKTTPVEGDTRADTGEDRPEPDTDQRHVDVLA